MSAGAKNEVVVACRSMLVAGTMVLALGANVAQGQDTEVRVTPENGCVGKYSEPKFTARPKMGKPVADEMERIFDARFSWGVPENVTIETPAFVDHPVFAVHYPAGSSAPTARNSPRGGAGFYAEAGLGESRNSACLSYRVWFPDDFQWVRGGKLPGLFGGEDPPSGGDRPEDDDGFTMRLMWRVDGDGELYLYAPNMDPTSDDGGQSLGRGNWRFETGRWHEIQLEVILNNPGTNNGSATTWIDGDLKLVVNGIQYRETDRIDIAGFMFSTFFGGSGPNYAPDQDQVIYFDQIDVYGMRVGDLDEEVGD